MKQRSSSSSSSSQTVTVTVDQERVGQRKFEELSAMDLPFGRALIMMPGSKNSKYIISNVIIYSALIIMNVKSYHRKVFLIN